MRSGSAVEVKGLGSPLLSAMKRLMAACTSTSEPNVPRRNHRGKITPSPASHPRRSREWTGLNLLDEGWHEARRRPHRAGRGRQPRRAQPRQPVLWAHPVPARDCRYHRLRRRRLGQDPRPLSLRPAPPTARAGDHLQAPHQPQRPDHILKHRHKTIRPRDRQCRQLVCWATAASAQHEPTSRPLQGSLARGSRAHAPGLVGRDTLTAGHNPATADKPSARARPTTRRASE